MRSCEQGVGRDERGGATFVSLGVDESCNRCMAGIVRSAYDREGRRRVLSARNSDHARERDHPAQQRPALNRVWDIENTNPTQALLSISLDCLDYFHALAKKVDSPPLRKR